VEGVEMNAEFWSGRRVFLTGHTGFKGSWLSMWLQRMGAEVHGFALAPHTEPSLFKVADVASGMTSGYGDVRDLGQLTAALRAAAPEVVFHLAALPIVRESYMRPVEHYQTNVMGTVNLLEAVRSTPEVRAVVVITSDKCYENREWLWAYREDEAMGGLDPYSSSKGCAELVVSAYRRSFFGSVKGGHPGAVASVRAGNVIGGGDWARDRLIPDIMRSLLQGQPITIRQPRAIRPWQHVLEPLAGYLTLAQALVQHGEQYAEGWNFGPPDDDAQPVQWVTQRVVELWDGGAELRIDPSASFHEAHQLKLDSSKARARLGWRSRWALERALGEIVSWFKHYKAGADMRNVVLEQINQYTADVEQTQKR
jgi:CDP-glucose 4,6-dehydratase